MRETMVDNLQRWRPSVPSLTVPLCCSSHQEVEAVRPTLEFRLALAWFNQCNVAEDTLCQCRSLRGDWNESCHNVKSLVWLPWDHRYPRPAMGRTTWRDAYPLPLRSQACVWKSHFRYFKPSILNEEQNTCPAKPSQDLRIMRNHALWLF